MSEPVSVKVSSRYQIALPSAARRRLKIQAGDRLLVDIQDGLLVLIPQPKDYTTHMAGLYREVWEGVDTTGYLNEERDAWDTSASG